MSLLQAILKQVHPGLKDFEIYASEGAECHSYIKQTDGKYLSCSDEQAVAVGLSKSEDLLGLTDYDVLAEQEASQFRINDNKVILTRQTIVTNEKFTWFDGKKMLSTSIKTPLYSKLKKIIGIMGVSLLREDLSDDVQFKNDLFLTPRQTECLYYLIKGCTYKEIANALNLSMRTVEHHFEVIRIKLNCTRRSTLIARALLIPSIKNKLLEDK